MIRNHLNILVHLAKIDGEFQEDEINLIYDLGIKNGLSDAEIKDIISNPQPFRVESLGLLDKFDQLCDVVNLMLADKKILESELRFCVKLAKKMDLQEVMTSILIKIIAQGEFTEKEKEEIRREMIHS